MSDLLSQGVKRLFEKNLSAEKNANTAAVPLSSTSLPSVQKKQSSLSPSRINFDITYEQKENVWKEILRVRKALGYSIQNMMKIEDTRKIVNQMRLKRAKTLQRKLNFKRSSPQRLPS